MVNIRIQFSVPDLTQILLQNRDLVHYTNTQNNSQIKEVGPKAISLAFVSLEESDPETIWFSIFSGRIASVVIAQSKGPPDRCGSACDAQAVALEFVP